MAPATAMAQGNGAPSNTGRDTDIRVQANAKAGDRDDGVGSYFDFDLVLPLPLGMQPDRTVFVQPGFMLSQEAGSRRLQGASVGLAYRFAATGGVYGINAFYDRNWVEDEFWTQTIVHDRVSVGADFQDNVNYLSANYYRPRSNDFQRFGALAHYREYATEGVDLYYTRSIDGRWLSKSRVFYEIDRRFDRPAAFPTRDEDRLTVSSGMSYLLNCSVAVGFQIEHDFLRGETTPSLSLNVAFGGTPGGPACEIEETARGRARLFSFVQREKLVSVRHVVSPYRLTELPGDTTRLFHVVGGDEDSDTVWLLQQGGPTVELGDGNDLIPFAHDHETATGERPLLVNVHQIQTFNPELFQRMDFAAIQQVQAEMDLSVEILDRVIRYFKARNKKVVVFSHSFGSFVVPRYLMLKGPGAADAYVIMAGRLDIERKVARNKLSKLHDASPNVYVYDDDGVTVQEYEYSQQEVDEYLVDGKLPLTLRLQNVFQGVLGRFRYTETLRNLDLSKVVYAFGTGDEAVGRLTEKEIEFLESRNARVVAVSAQGGSHGSMVDDPDAREEILNLLP